MCVPLAVQVYGCWGPEAQTNFSRFAIRSNFCKSQTTSTLYGRLNLVLVPELCCPVRWQLAVSLLIFSVLVVCFLYIVTV